MSFLDVQDLATVTAQSGLGQLLIAWCADSDEIIGALEVGFVAVLAGLVFRRRSKGRE